MTDPLGTIREPLTPTLSQGARERRRLSSQDALAVLCLVALVGYVLRDPLTTGRLVIGHDMDQPFNWEAFNRQAFAQGQLPLWNPYVFSGFPAQADIQAGVFYPPNWLLRPLPLELGAFFMWSLAMHLVLLGAAPTRCAVRSAPAVWRRSCRIGVMLGGVSMPRVFGGHLLLIYGFCWMPAGHHFGPPFHRVRPAPATSRPGYRVDSAISRWS